MANYKEKLAQITTLIFDYDGVFTNGDILLTDIGEMIRTVNVKDGYVLQLAVKKGLHVAIISGGNSPAIKLRFNRLGIHDVFLSVENKVQMFEEYCAQNQILPEQVLYMGDDIPDYKVLQLVGVSTCPKDAAIEVKSIVDYISDCDGGKGCVRDVVEQVMKVKGMWMSDEVAYKW